MNVLGNLSFAKNRHLQLLLKFFCLNVCFSETQPSIFATQNGKKEGWVSG